MAVDAGTTGAELKIRSASTVDQVPIVLIQMWKIYEVTTWEDSARTRHFVGYNLNERGGQVSSAITRFNRRDMSGITISGRVYQLIEEPGLDPLADRVWQRWCGRFHVRTVKEIDPKSWLSWYL